MPRGNKVKWSDFLLGVLYVEIERVRSQSMPRGTIKEAAAALAAETRWSLLLKKYEGYKYADRAEALRRAYFKAKKTKWTGVLHDFFRLQKKKIGSMNGRRWLLTWCESRHPK